MKTQYAPENVPSRVIYEITQLCVFDCPDCIARVEKPYLKGPSQKEMIAIGTKCVDEGVPSISWTGGEPYIRKEFLSAIEEIVNYDRENKVVQTVDTAGVLITPDIARKSADSFSLARVSLYGTSETFYQETGLSENSKYGYFDAYRGIQNFIDAKLPVQINVPVYALEDLDEVVNNINERWSDNLMIEEVVFIPRIVPDKSADADALYPSFEQIDKYIEKHKEIFRFKSRLFKWKSGKHMVIKADNFAYAHPVDNVPGGLLRIGSALELSIKELWSKFPNEFRQDHRDLTPDVSHLKK